jgi:sigma-B regulation protein RsbU (phosphoserine phosphatase)
MQKTGKYGHYFGRLEQIFLALVGLYAVLFFSRIAPGLGALVAFAAFILGLIISIRLLRRSMRTAIWRLRNRLVVAYLFIAVVPIVLILALVGIASYALLGQMAVYLVNTELNRRISFLSGPVEGLIRIPGAGTDLFVARFVPLIQSRFPVFDMRISGRLETRYPPNSGLQAPAAWPDANGLVRKGKGIYAWVHARANGSELTLLAPITHELLSQLVPGLGDVDLIGYTAPARESQVPPKQNALDVEVSFPYPLTMASWDSPNQNTTGVLVVRTRVFAVLGTVFGEKTDWAAGLLAVFVMVAVLFLLVEIVSLIAGVRLTRTITGAVHELYQGTMRVKEGDFAYRIPVRGDDQLAELSASFNSMTDNLGRLIVVAKENERLQSELAIAREVQAQLFPKAAPSIHGLTLTGVCNPARTVSGDYYDYLPVSDCAVAFAIGDVAGKGISAALLMATIQSAMRAQWTAGNLDRPSRLSTATMVATLNRQLYANTSPEKYATFYFALYDDAAHTLTYTNAGHLPPLLLRQGEFQKLDPNGTVVGAFPSVRYGEQTVALEPRDILVAYTDGIVEPENVYGEMFGEDRLRDLLLRYAQADSSELIARTMEAVVQWTGSSELQDDMTMVVAKRS